MGYRFGQCGHENMCSEKICSDPTKLTVRKIYIRPLCYGGGGFFVKIIGKPYYVKTYKSLKSAINNTIRHYKYLPLEDTLALMKLKEKLCNDGS